MPAREAFLVSFALARAVGAGAFARQREDQERVAVEVHVGVGLKLLLGFGDCGLPAAGVNPPCRTPLASLAAFCLGLSSSARFVSFGIAN